MRIAMLANGGNVHTIRWANALTARGMEIHLFSLHAFSSQLSARVVQHKLPVAPPLGYFLNAFGLKKQLGDLSPNLLHTHYASGYGTLGRLSGFHPQVLSVWGSDVFLFPDKSRLHRKLIERNLRNADLVCSTGHVMACRTRQICSNIKDLAVTPFGVDIEEFVPDWKRIDTDEIVIGTVKTLEWNYGIDILIRAFAAARLRVALIAAEAARRMRLLIVGAGNKRDQLEALSEQCGIGEVTTYAGSVPHNQVPAHLCKMDVYCALSRSESFGVAILEASACGVPVVVSDVGGLPEVVVAGRTGCVVKAEDVAGAAECITQLVLDPVCRRTMGQAGRAHVVKNYSWHESVAIMESNYRKTVRLPRRSAACPPYSL